MTASGLHLTIPNGRNFVHIRQTRHGYVLNETLRSGTSGRALESKQNGFNVSSAAQLDEALRALGVAGGTPEPVAEFLAHTSQRNFPPVFVEKRFSSAELDGGSSERVPPVIRAVDPVIATPQERALDVTLSQIVGQLAQGPEKGRRGPRIAGLPREEMPGTARLRSVSAAVKKLATAKVDATRLLGFEPDEALINVSHAEPLVGHAGWYQASSEMIGLPVPGIQTPTPDFNQGLTL